MAKPRKKEKKNAVRIKTVQKKKKKKSKSLTEALSRRLHGSQFRSLNEELYTQSGEANFVRFSSEPSLAEAYHRGYREQTLRWPLNPLDEIIVWLSIQKKQFVIADMGCGEARLAHDLEKRHQVHSFDLVATRPCVTACNIAHTPLESSTVDVVVFCLSLMGPSFWLFLREAHRILKPKGLLRIAEVRSRFDEEHGGFEAFERGLRALGFDKQSRETSSKMFVSFLFTKSLRPPKSNSDKSIAGFSLKPCLYKRR